MGLNNFSLTRVILLLSITILTSSCTREEKTTKTEMRLSIPTFQNVGGLVVTAADLVHIVINVSGPGISPVIKIDWDGHNGATAPASFKVDVPSGENRLFQLLLVYQADADAGKYTFKYGDTVASLSGGDIVLNLGVTDVGTAGVGTGSIAGRHLDHTDYTGPLALKYFPPSGRPSMLIEYTEVHGGWFDAFALDGVPLSYVMADGTDFFGAPINSMTGLVSGDPAYRTLISVPAYYEYDGTNYNLQSGGKSIYGWFGTTLSTEEICYYNNAASTGSPVDVSDNLFLGPSTSSPLKWDHDGINDAIDAIDALRVNGGTLGTADSSPCAVGGKTAFTNLLSVDYRQVASHGGVLGFRGPFKRVDFSSGNGGFVSIPTPSASMSIQWEYLPGVFATSVAKGVTGADVFARVYNNSTMSSRDNFMNDNHMVDCNTLASSFEFSLLESNPISDNGGSLNETYSTSNSTLITAYSVNDLQIVICPYTGTSSSKTYFKTTADYGTYGGGP